MGAGDYRVLNSLVDPRIGGPQIRALEVAKRLRERGIETVFLLPDGAGEFNRRASEEGFGVSRPGIARMKPPSEVVTNLGYVASFPSSVWQIQREIEQRNIDLVHASMTINFQAAVAAQLSSTPLAWFFNDTLTPFPLNKITAGAANLLADETAFAAKAVYPHFFSGSAENVRTLYPPVDVDYFDPANANPERTPLLDEFGLDDSWTVIGTVGNINPIKGHAYLLKAISKIDAENENIIVPVAGKILESRDVYFDKLQRLRAKLGLDRTVQFLGHRSDIRELLSEFDVFVLPSTSEACPISLLEAMAMERPVVATDVGGVAEQVTDGEHGWVVPPKDSNALASAISDALQSPDKRQERGEAARRRAKEMFSLDACVDRHVDLYDDALSSA